MDRDEWNSRYAAEMMRRADIDAATATASAAASDDAFAEGEDPEEAAAEELSYWTDDEGGKPD